MKVRTVRFVLLCMLLALGGGAVVLEVAARWGGLVPLPRPPKFAAGPPYYPVKKDGPLRFAADIVDNAPEPEQEAPPDGPPAPADSTPQQDGNGSASPEGEWRGEEQRYRAAEPSDYPAKAAWKKWQKYEARFQLSWSFANPYDPDEIAVDAIITAPSGRVEVVPAFWFVPCKGEVVPRRSPRGNPDEDTEAEEVITQTGPGTWMLRYTPREEGEYRYQLVARTPTASAWSSPVTFVVSGEGGRGFVRASRTDHRYFEFDNGEFFFPIGQNVCWANDLGSINFAAHLAAMKEHGANWARVWLTHFFKGQTLEWSRSSGQPYFHGLGFYSAEMAWKLDQMLAAAEQRDMFLMWCIQHHGQLSTYYNPDWHTNPYNRKCGGFLENPADFFTDARARALFKQRMRYLVARYGYSPNLFAWEFWNEVSLTDGFSLATSTVWHKEMADYVRGIDPTGRMLTTSYGPRYYYGRRAYADAFGLPTLDFAQVHMYHGAALELAPWTMRTIGDQMKDVDGERRAGKPILIGEYGLGHRQTYFKDSPDTKWPVDPHGLHVHNSLWVGLFSASAGTAMNWWWDRYIERNNLHFHFRGISRYLAGEDLRAWALRPVKLFDSYFRTPPYLCYALVGPNRAYGWLFETGHTIESFAPRAEPRTGVKIELRDMADGDCWVEFWNTYDGVPTARVKTAVLRGTLEFEVPPFRGDIAFKVFRGTSVAELCAETPLHDRMMDALQDLARRYGKLPRD